MGHWSNSKANQRAARRELSSDSTSAADANCKAYREYGTLVNKPRQRTNKDMESSRILSDKLVLMTGGLSVDDRGDVSFINDFRFQGVKRFYMVSNHRAGYVRAWHAHRREGKYVTAVSGAAVVGAVKIDNWENPSQQLPVDRFVLSAKKPSVLFIPPGYANGFMSLTDDLKLMFFSGRERGRRYPLRQSALGHLAGCGTIVE